MRVKVIQVLLIQLLAIAKPWRIVVSRCIIALIIVRIVIHCSLVQSKTNKYLQ